jgi:hypothetical protein
MAKQTINIGSGELTGDGESLRSAFDKINDNFDEVYTGSGTTLGSDTTPALGGNLDLSGNDITGIGNLNITGNITATGSINASLAYSNLTGTPTTLAGYGITDAVTAGGDFEGNLSGSVFADDSTLLVDGVNGTLTAGALTGALPALDGSALTDVAAVTSNTTVFTARADVNLLMGEVVYLTGISGNTPTIDKAQANSSGTMPAFGIVKEDVTANNNVEVITFGSCPGHDAANFGETSITFALGDTVYVSATEAGKLTNVAPAGESNLIQNIGKIERATPTTNMTIKVGGAGRTNATPALDEGKIFIGTAQNRSSTMSFATAMSTYGGALTGDVTGSVFADDSTLLVDGVNGTLNSSALTKPIALADNEKITFGDDDDLEIFHNSSNGNTIIENTGNLVIKGSNLFLQSASSEYFFRGAANGAVTLYYDNVAKFETTADGVSVTGKITGLTDPTAAQDAATKAYVDASVFDGAFGSLSGTPTTLAGYGITDAANTGSATTFTANVLFDTGVQEKFATLTGSTGVTAMDCDNGQVFYLTGAAGDITANFTNLGLTAEYGTNVTVIINQGATPYEVTAVQIGGAAQTINWQGGTPPTGNTNGIDSFSFTILNDGGTYVVLGQMVDFT